MGREDGIMGVTAWTRGKTPKVVADTRVLILNQGPMSRSIMTSKISLDLSPRGTRGATTQMMVPKEIIPELRKAGFEVRILEGAPQEAPKVPFSAPTKDVERKVLEAVGGASEKPFPGPLPPVAPPTPLAAPQPSGGPPARPEGEEKGLTETIPAGPMPEAVAKLASRTRGELMRECSKLGIECRSATASFWRGGSHGTKGWSPSRE
jgi:hypothetical protein